MSAPAPSWRAPAGRWLRRGGAAVAGALFDAVVDSLELGKRCVAWLTHSHGARVVAVAALAVAVVCATTAAVRVVAPSTRAMARAASQPHDNSSA